MTSITVSGTNGFSAAGQTSQLTALATMSNGASVDVGGQALWQSADSTIASVSTTGLVTALKAGSTQIIASYQGQTGRTSVGMSPFIATWTIVDANTGGVVKAVIRWNGDAVAARLFGSCVPVLCDWGEVTVSGQASGPLNTIFTFTFAVVNATFTLGADEHLSIATHNHFTDTSGRPDYDAIDVFKR